ncbi:RNA ligase family protein [Stenotrophomonas rhizophila]|uniref:RNA ligase domain-containing protein n=1 Tax=Stenotrophomonas rhizophila TaxID=216778 RepID=A0A7V7YDN2_9GAMM|nr:RNA ligase family protein [Stenotrophomonas rhizophila]KAB7628906.1 hypothetical protein F9K92_15795 [Stenotrophomonas rhizophila]
MQVIEFERYPTIDTLSENIKMRCLRSTGHWYAVEKIHGANYQFITNGLDVRVASRNRLLTDEEFFGHSIVFERYKDIVVANHGRLTSQGVIRPGQVLRVFGELAGVNGNLKVQDNAEYGALDFYAFDLIADGARLPYLQVMQLEGLKKAPLVTSGTFADVMNERNKYPTLVDGSCTCEGNILRCDETGEVYKHKNDLFVEKVVRTGFSRQYVLYITDNRVRAVVSKEGPFERQKFSQYIQMIAQDIAVDMGKDGLDLDFDGKEKQLISQAIAAVFVRKEVA